MVHTTRRGLIKMVKFLKKKPVWHNLLFLKSASWIWILEKLLDTNQRHLIQPTYRKQSKI